MFRTYLDQLKETDLGKYWENLTNEKFTPSSLEVDDYTAIVSRYEKVFARKPDLLQPKRFSEKLQWLKLFYRNSDMPLCADKYGVRRYLEERGYSRLLNPLLGVYDHPDEIDVSALPNRFVLKAAHGSGWNLICHDKRRLNWFLWSRISASWLRQNFVVHGREWHYSEIQPRLVVEHYLEDDSGQLRDFKVFCMNGIATCMQIDANRNSGNQRRSFVARNGTRMGTVVGYPQLDRIEPEWPIEEMFRLAEELSKPFPHVRIDFYATEASIIFGEFTFFDGSGLYVFDPPEDDFRWGAALSLPDPNYNLALLSQIISSTD